MPSELINRIRKKQESVGEPFADVLIDLCFVTSYKIEELIKMPPYRLKRLIERFRIHFEKKEKTK